MLSLFPGIGLLDRAFEEEGFCVVRGPDVLWGGDVRRFSPPVGKFDGVIGGPPCQAFSAMQTWMTSFGRDRATFGNLIPEYERVVREARPSWFIMENVDRAPLPDVDGYQVVAQVLNNRWFIDGDSDFGAEQNRKRRFCFGTPDGRRLSLDVALMNSPVWAYAVVSGHVAKHGKSVAKYHLPDMCRLQGLPETFLSESPFTPDGKRKAVGNAVPLPMGRAVARGVRRAMGLPLVEREAVS